MSKVKLRLKFFGTQPNLTQPNPTQPNPTMVVFAIFRSRSKQQAYPKVLS
jgi:hypothetical protein